MISRKCLHASNLFFTLGALSMTFVYPAQASQLVSRRWQEFQDRQASGRPFPDDGSSHRITQSPFPSSENLDLILDTTYHASFLVEEGRRLYIRLLYLPPNICNEGTQHTLNHSNTPFVMQPPRALTVSEILRLAPALDPFQSTLVVCADSDLDCPTGSAPVVIWGILQLGTQWWRVLSGRDTAALAPPNCLSISSSLPGQLTATTMGCVLMRLAGGAILQMPLEDIGEGVIGEFLKPDIDYFYSVVCRKLKISSYDSSSDMDAHPRQTYLRTLTNIVGIAKEKGHGATFVVASDSAALGDQALTSHIHLKHAITGASAWEHLIEESIANRKFYTLLFPDKENYTSLIDDGSKASPVDLRKLREWESRLHNTQEKIRDYENFTASLSGVDGCVLMTTRLDVLGFGGEILTQSPALDVVRVASDPSGEKFSEIPITSFGTRHRSAFRLCSSTDKCLVFIVSQDGGVKAVRKVGNDILLWPDVNMGRYDL
jgi:hypothetical protein